MMPVRSCPPIVVDGSGAQSTFMRDAVNELTRCRVTLKWSYAMAYFLVAGNQKQIFEDIQAYVFSAARPGSLTDSPCRDLEKAVEDLSQLLDEPVDADSVKSLRQRMMDKTVCGLHSTRRCNTKSVVGVCSRAA